MRLASFIAGRYLIAKKSHNVINIISAISSIGMAIGTAALIIILSVYNGFDSLIMSMMSNVEPDLLIRPSQGKVFSTEDQAYQEAYDWLSEQPSTKGRISCILQEDVFIDYGGQQNLVQARGVDQTYEKNSPLRNQIINGNFRLHHGDIANAGLGLGIAQEMGINPRSATSYIEIYFPSRTRNISMANPAASLEMVKVWPEFTFSVNNEIDKELIILPIESMRELLEYDNEVSAVEVRVSDPKDKREINRIQKELKSILGPDFKVQDRFEQNESLYRMMNYEKLAIYLIFIFIIVIISFNIFGSLSMLMIEKKDDIETLRCLGAKEKLIRRIFIIEGWMISLCGIGVGLVLGLGFTLLQQHFGIITMPGQMSVQAYPVIISWGDIALTICIVAGIGLLIATLPVRYRMRRKQS